MTEHNCNIIKDLLPLYIEDICSEDSKKLVEEHLKECSSCKETYELLHHTALVIDVAEKKEINAIKKIKSHTSNRLRANYFWLLATIAIVILLLLYYVSELSSTTYLLLMPLVILGTGCTFYRMSSSGRSSTRLWKLLLVVQGIGILYSIALLFYTMHTLNSTGHFWGLPPYKIGPFLSLQFTLIIIASLLILIFHLYQVILGKMQYSLLSNLSISCIFLTLSYQSMLYQMVDLDSFWEQLVHKTLLFPAVGIITTLFIWLAPKIKHLNF